MPLVPNATHPSHTPAPPNADAQVASHHRGPLHVFAPPPPSQALVHDASELVQDAVGGRDWITTRAVPKPYSALSTVRETLGNGPRFRRHIAQVCQDLGLDAPTQVDAPRLRSITAGAEHTPAAAPVYVMHRDTWYGCPQSLLVAWIPLHDVKPTEVFAVYPDWFAKPLPNNSRAHDQAAWMAEVGWHGDAPVARFSAPTVEFERGEEVRLGMPAGSICLFSAAHLHQTFPNPTPGNTRYSLDFRIFPGGPTQAPNTDNQSRGAQARLGGEFWTIGSF